MHSLTATRCAKRCELIWLAVVVLLTAPAYGQMNHRPQSPNGVFYPPPSSSPIRRVSHEAAIIPNSLPPPSESAIARRDLYAFNFQDAPWSMVLRNFARHMGTSLQFKAEPAGTFTYFDHNRYSLLDAVDIFNDYLIPAGHVLIWNERRLVLAKIGEPLPEGLIPYVRMDELYLLGRNTLATVTIPIQRIEAPAAVAEVKELLSSLGSVHALQNSQRVVITDTGAYLRRVVHLLVSSGMAGDAVKSHVYQLRNAPAAEVAAAINQFLVARRPSAPNKNGIQLVVPESTTNSLLIHGTVSEIADVQALINQLDRTPSQVNIQALLVEVQLGNTDELGVEVGLQDSVLFDRGLIDNVVSVTEVIEGGGTKTTSQNVLSQRQTPGFNFNNQPLGQNSVANPSKVGGQSLSNFALGRVNGDLGFGGLVLSAGSESISVLIRALASRFKTDVLSRPQIRTLDNHEALIQIGQQVPIVDGVAITAVGSANPVIRQDKAGIILKVTPRIGANGKVQINVNAEKSAFQLAPGSGVPIFTDATNGNVIEAPVKDITTATTSVSVQTGQTIVLGGMITRDVSTVERKVPWLGDVPIVGRAFRYDFEEVSRKELLIFLTPHIVLGDDDQQEFNMREMSRMCFPHELVDELHGDVSGFNANPEPYIPDESVPAGPRSINTLQGETIPIPPFANNAEADRSSTTGWQPFNNWQGRLPSTQTEARRISLPPHASSPPVPFQ